MGLEFGGVPLVDPKSVYESCARMRLPTDTFWGLANSYTNPLGSYSGGGHVLMTRGGLDALDLSAPHDLVIEQAVEGGDTGLKTVTYRNLHVVLTRCVTPGLRDDANACHLVELADRRRLALASPIDGAYNLRSSPGGADYYSATLDSGSPWTWAGAVGDVWAAVGLFGAFPGLPYAPDGVPDGWAFHGSYALDALDMLLTRLSCAVAWDGEADTYSIVRTGDADATASDALARSDRLRCWDAEFIEPALARYPQRCRVTFPRHRVVPDATGGSPFYSVDVTDPAGTPAGVLSGTYAIVPDDLPAFHDAAGAVTNAAALATRAAERAANFFQSLRLDLLDRTFAEPMDAAGLRPGARVKATRHGDRGRGSVTQLAVFGGQRPGDLLARAGGGDPVGRAGDGSPYTSVYGCDCPCPDPMRSVLQVVNNFSSAFVTSQGSGYTTTATAGGTTTLDAAGTLTQYFTGTTTQTVQLPVVSTLTLGKTYEVVNDSTGVLTVQSSGGDTVATVQPGTTSTFTVTSTSGTDASSWSYRSCCTTRTPGSTFVPTAGTTTTLTALSTQTQYFTGTTTQTVQMPVVSTLTLGQPYEIINNSTGVVTVTSSGGNTITTVPAGTTSTFTYNGTAGTGAASWDASYTGFATVPGGTSWSTVSVTAAGTTQGGAAALTSGANNTVSGITGSATGVILDSGDAPTVVYNTDGLNTLKVYPPSGGKITIFGSTNAAYTMNAATCQVFYRGSSTQWFVGAQMT